MNPKQRGEKMKGKLLLVIALMLVSVVLADGKILGTVLDENDNRMTARVRFYNFQKGFLSTIYTNWDGTFEIYLSKGEYEIEVTKGPEFERKIYQLKLEDDEEIRLSITLKRLCDLTKMGWFGGDTHMHTIHSDGKQNPEELALACSAAGLSWAILTDHNTLGGKDEWLSLSNRGIITIIGEEVTTKIGHLNAMGIAKLVQWQPAQSDDDIKKIFDEIHSQDALTQINHPFDLKNPFEKLHIESYDLIEIWNGGAPPIVKGLGNGEAQQYWYKLLNEGKRIPAIAASDCHDIYSAYSLLGLLPFEIVLQILKKELPNPEFLDYVKNNEQTLRNWVKYGLFPGTPRTYVNINQVTEKSILQALKNGKSFMTNGPLLLANIDGKQPGEEVSSSQKVFIDIDVISNQPIKELRVVQAGKPVCSMVINDKEVFSCRVQIDPTEGEWVVVEVFGDYPVYAITNPIYLKANKSY